jgi:DNA-binding CsgD family transcriptional regulator
MAHNGHLERFTPREWDVASRVMRGMPNKEIAAELGISPYTVRVFVRILLNKAGVANRTELTAHLYEYGVADQAHYEHLSGLLRDLAFPKQMHWDARLEDGRGELLFGRPIRWLLLLYGGRVVPYTIGRAPGAVSRQGQAVDVAQRGTGHHRVVVLDQLTVEQELLEP